MHRRDVQRLPACVAFSRIVAVLVAVADRGDRPPKIVLEFGIPIDDEAIGETHGHQCEHSRALCHREAVTSGGLPGRLEPCGPKVGLCPEAHGVGLRVGPLRAFHSAHFLGFVVIARVNGTAEGRGRSRAELTRALHAPRLGRRILREQRRRGRYPYARRGERAVCVGHVCRVALTFGVNRARDLFAQINTRNPCRVVRNGFHRLCEGCIDPLFLARILAHENFAGSRCCRGLGRGIWVSWKLQHVARISALHRIDRIRHGHVHQRHAARPRITGHVDRLHHVHCGVVPVGDDIRVDRRIG